MERLELQLATPFLTRRDILACLLTNRRGCQSFPEDLFALKTRQRIASQRLLGAIRVTAATFVASWWKAFLIQAWIAQVAAEVEDIHPSSSLGGSRFLRSFGPSSLCPECGVALVDTAAYDLVGEKMLRTSRFVDVGCRACVLSSPRRDPPLVTMYHVSSRRSSLIWTVAHRSGGQKMLLTAEEIPFLRRRLLFL